MGNEYHRFETISGLKKQQSVLARFTDIPSLLSLYDSDDPIFVLYPERLRARAHEFISGCPTTILYAVKANPHPFVLQSLWNAGINRYDVASIREINLVAETLPDARMYLMHPVKSRKTLRHAYDLGVRDFAVDCHAELLKISEEVGIGSDICLHVRLDLSELSKPEGAHRAAMPLERKFGAGGDEAIALLSAIDKMECTIGVTFHVGSQCLDPAAYDAALAYARIIVDRAGVEISSLDVGGGFPVSYPGMIAQPLSSYFDRIKSALSRYGFDTIETIAEPGRALVAEAGSTLARVELRKGRDLYLNDGTYGSLFDAGSCGWRYPVHLHKGQGWCTNQDLTSQSLTAFRFYGPTCDSLDCMEGPFMLPNHTDEGDWIEICNLGAYGQALQSRFNGFFGETTVIIDHAAPVFDGVHQPRSNSMTINTHAYTPHLILED